MFQGGELDLQSEYARPPTWKQFSQLSTMASKEDCLEGFVSSVRKSTSALLMCRAGTAVGSVKETPEEERGRESS